MSREVRVLIVDDNSNMVKTLRDIFASVGCEAVGVETGAAALQRLNERRFDCVLSDIALTGLSGVALHQAIRERWPKIPVVLMTAYMTENLVEEQLAAGALAVLEKPLDIHLLLDFITYLQKMYALTAIVEDVQDYQMLGNALRRRGYTVTWATGPSEAWKTEVASGSLVLLDLDLERADGLDILRQLVTTFPQHPILLLTERYQKAAATAAAKMDACFYITVPYTVQQLAHMIPKIQRGQMRRLLKQPGEHRK